MSTNRAALEADIASVNRIAAVPRILDAVVKLTGMRFAAITRVTESTWTACAVRDDLDFGLAPGGELELESTICNEIRHHHQPVVFGHASQHPHFSQHHTPRRYGLESYISIPIFRADGNFFGTLCAIDSRPAELGDPAILESLQLFAELIGLQLELTEDLVTARRQLLNVEAHRQLREDLMEATDREIRDLFQPIVTGVYLLRTSTGISASEREIIMQMEDCCLHIRQRLRDKLDHAYGRIEGAPAARRG